jgi:hypothetical protein
MTELIGFGVDAVIKYEMLDRNWIEKLLNERFKAMLEKHDISFRKKVELDKQRNLFEIQKITYKKYLNSLDDEGLQEFMKNNLKGINDGTYLENMSSNQIFSINGETKLFPSDEMGYPIIPRVSEKLIESCDIGFHIKNKRCRCEHWKTCPLGEKSYLVWLEKFGSNHEQNRYLEEMERERRLSRRMV